MAAQSTDANIGPFVGIPNKGWWESLTGAEGTQGTAHCTAAGSSTEDVLSK